MKDVNILTSNGVNVDEALEIFGDMEAYDESLGDFLAEAPKKLAEIKSFKELSDMANYAILTHSLKSDAKYFGFTKLADLAYQHEMESKANNVAFVYDNYDALMKEANRILDLVRAYSNGSNFVAPPVEEDDIEVLSLAPERDKAIIVVDDSHLVLNYLQKVFYDEFEVMLAKNGEDAIKIVEENLNKKKIAGMLLDLNMPGSDGFAVLDYFRDNNLFAVIPVAIITGNEKSEVDQRAFEHPIVDMLKKPFNERDVRIIVEKMGLFNNN